jgi:CRP/FNR family transcriptional regulator, cyclic AMP receptor protein
MRWVVDQSKLIETLASINFLHGASREHLKQIAALSEVLEYGESEIVFREGEVADSAYLVVSGKLSLELSPATIFRKCLVDVGTGEMLGWSSLVENSHFAATAVVAQRARLVRIDGPGLRAICDGDPQFGYEFMRRAMLALAKRLKVTWTQLSHLHVSQYLPVTAPGDE